MLPRSLWLSLALLCASPALGCLLDGEGRGGSASTGGSGAGGSSGSTGTSATSGGGGTSATGTDPDCSAGCDDGRPCTNDVCQSGACAHVDLPAGTLISAGDPGDCRRSVCDDGGNVIDVPDDTEVSSMAPGACYGWICENGSSKLDPANEGQACGAPSPCQSSKCQSGSCTTVNVPDGAYPLPSAGECAKVTCSNGNAGSPIPDTGLCDLQPQNGGCRVPECGMDAGADFVCYLINAPMGLACIKPGGGQGACNNAGICL